MLPLIGNNSDGAKMLAVLGELKFYLMIKVMGNIILNSIMRFL